MDHPNTTCFWSKVSGLTQGMAVIYSSTPDACGHHYFGILPVDDKGDRALEDLPGDEKYQDDRSFLAWAASQDGINWKFLNDSNIGPINCSYWETSNPKNAFPFIHRDCFQRTGYNGQVNPFGFGTFHHLSAFYSDPTKYDRYGNYGDGYIYLIFGYTPSVGVWNLMARVKLDLNTSFGLGEVQLFKGDPDGLYCPIYGSWETEGRCTGSHYACSSISETCDRAPFSRPGDACIPCTLDVANNKYIFNLAVPLDWKPIYKGNLLLEHILIYKPAYDFFNAQTLIRVSDRIVPPFYFSEEKAVGNCLISANGYSPCEAGGDDLGILQPPCTQYWVDRGYYDNTTNCTPLAVVSYFNGATQVCNMRDITNNSGGIVSSKLDLKNVPWTYPMCYYGEGFKMKRQGQNLHLWWTPSTDGRINSYRVYEGNMGENFLKDGTHCSAQQTDDKIAYDHFRKVCYTENNYIDIPIESGNKYYLIAPICDYGNNIFQCYNGQNYFPFAYISEGPFCSGTNIERKRGVCHCPEDGGCGGFYEYFPQPGEEGGR